MSITIDAIDIRKCHIQVSDAGSYPTIEDFHTVHPNLIWNPGDSSEQWLKLNFYQGQTINNIELTWTGTFSQMQVEFSNNGFDWVPVSKWFDAPTETKTLDIDYLDMSKVQTAPYYRLRFTNTSSLIFTTLKFFIVIDTSFDHFISHNIYNLYGDEEREEFPLLPSITQTILEMYEKKEDIKEALELFDIDEFDSFGLTTDVIGGVLTISADSIPSNVKYYIWDFNDYNTLYAEGEDAYATISTDTLTTNVDLSDYSVDELATNTLTIYETVSSGGETVINTVDYTILTNTNDTSDNTITITSTFSQTHEADTFTIREYNDVTEIGKNNIISTQNPLLDSVHTYATPSVYYPRLVMKFPSFVLDFHVKITTT